MFQTISVFFELNVVTIALGPWYLMNLTYQFIDFLLDWLWYGIFFAWCLPCAWVFIWIFNIAFLPITVWGYFMRFHLELVGFVFDFFLLFFKGDGCFLRWGKYCWQAEKIKGRDHMTYTDLVALNVDPGASLFAAGSDMLGFISQQMGLENGQNLMSTDFMEFGKKRRAKMAETCPMVPETTEFLSSAMHVMGEKAREIIANMDF
jgi:hypothetical protein